MQVTLLLTCIGGSKHAPKTRKPVPDSPAKRRGGRSQTFSKKAVADNGRVMRSTKEAKAKPAVSAKQDAAAKPAVAAKQKGDAKPAAAKPVVAAKQKGAAKPAAAKVRPMP